MLNTSTLASNKLVKLASSMLLHYVGEGVFDLSESLGIVSDTPFEETKRVLTFRP